MSARASLAAIVGVIYLQSVCGTALDQYGLFPRRGNGLGKNRDSQRVLEAAKDRMEHAYALKGSLP